ncbi:hypothetical protein LJU02_09420 [Corynebacterium pseudotuberculosis]|uniref:Uncharacterized protein n=2 Tax=Corynebacterium pseudotuberculosis TaxID=1719 RepID=A0AAU8PZ68_CORPS|nr:hypothetical protein [Corynebacterium pseudotuberculosis]AEQ07373.1 hypothetical protein CPCIP5297_09530 [Corynebacterium pseudotuberculosis CIP 52.97]AFB73191.1 hypothetical protein CP316_09520 [Corynebacterium pseudotuberculosis 316]AFH91635.1 hypothetical protein CP31_09735 [Corynebacterium pseudotuberculosis 31]AFK17478.1 hypothetical protein CP258_09530 [Corynebacterium pseudotuberculosis 258]AMN70683.1 hypothetical protein ATN02_09795 [Corynebacterium pseudotuberculosis]
MGSIEFLLQQAGWYEKTIEQPGSNWINWLINTSKHSIVDILTGKTGGIIGGGRDLAIGTHIPKFFQALLNLDGASAEGLGSSNPDWASSGSSTSAATPAKEAK